MLRVIISKQDAILRIPMARKFSWYSNNELIILDEKIGMIRLHQNCDLQGKRSHRGIDQNIRRTKFKTSHTHVLSKSYE